MIAIVRRRIALTLARWRRTLRIARDFLAFEAPRQIRLTRASFRGETAAWSTPQTALERFLVRGFFAVLAFIATERTPRQVAGEVLLAITLAGGIPFGAYLVGLIVGRLTS